MRRTRIIGCPTFTGTDPLLLPHMPCAIFISRPTRSICMSTSAPLPMRDAPRTGDAMRLCGAEIPDVDRVTACMIQKRSMLSDGCKAVFQYAPPAASPVSYAPSAKPGKPINLAPNKRG